MPRRNTNLSVVSLYTGAGGLDLGLEAAGFTIQLCVESDEDARSTIKANRPRWKLAKPGDIDKLNPGDILRQANARKGGVTVLAAGPPCQPFSKSAFWSNGDSPRLKDPRAKTLKAYLRVVETILPTVLLLENVSGLTFDGKDDGLRLVRQGIEAINNRRGTNYVLQVIHLNAADYGVPQIRERVFLIAHVRGLLIKVPPATHGPASSAPYRTAWDAIGDLDSERWPLELGVRGKWAGLLPSIPEGKNYLWHTPRSDGEPLFGWRTRYWSFLLKLAKDRPSWTIQAEPGPATGPFHWRSRLLSVEELCRLQTFPSGYRIFGNRRSAQRQLGNAVPCAIGELLGLEIRRQLFGHRVSRQLRFIPRWREDCPAPGRVHPVPPAYTTLRGTHKDHPGPGFGPAARLRWR